MKNIIILIISFLVYSTVIINGQPRRGDDRPPIPFEKFRQFEKAKLIEILDMDENTAIKFFSRRNESINRSIKLAEQRDELIEEIEMRLEKDDKAVNDKYLKDQIEKLLEIEDKMLDERKKFITSLDDILTQEQIMKFVVFDFRLKSEIKERIKQKK
jgi:hypothetical protein